MASSRRSQSGRWLVMVMLGWTRVVMVVVMAMVKEVHICLLSLYLPPLFFFFVFFFSFAFASSLGGRAGDGASDETEQAQSAKDLEESSFNGEGGDATKKTARGG